MYLTHSLPGIIGDVTILNIESTTIWMFVEQFEQYNNKENIKAPQLIDGCLIPLTKRASNAESISVCHNIILRFKSHDDVIKWKHFPRYWPFMRGIHRLPVNSPHKGQWHGALMFSLICAWTNGWVNNHDAGDLRRHRTHHSVTVMVLLKGP